MKPKGKEACLTIARRVYSKMPNSFYGSEFIKKMKREFRRQRIDYYDGTALRMMRELRKEGFIFECKDRSSSFYLKLN